MIIGPVFTREAVLAPRRPKHYLQRVIYVAALLILMCTSWLVLNGTQIISNLGDMARFGAVLFSFIAPLQLACVVFMSALGSASAVSQEKDRRTLILLLLSRLTNSELVVGKLLASLLNTFTLIVAAIPVFMLITLFGGVSFDQVLRVFLVTFGTSLVAGSLGSTFALWREKTFQTLAMTALAIVLWVGIWEVVNRGILGTNPGGLSCQAWAICFSPWHAILSATRPVFSSGTMGDPVTWCVYVFVGVSLAGAGLLNGVAIWRVRVWNPSREVRPGQQAAENESIWGAEHDLAQEPGQADEAARAGHVDSIGRAQQASRSKHREVWDNPILWREICTWAYGRKVLVIRLAYLLVAGMAGAALHWSVASGAATDHFNLQIIPAAAQPLVPFFFVSMVIVNALAVTAITNERDGQALDLLLATDLSPREFVFGKIGGILWVTKEMILIPMLMCGYLYWVGGLGLQNLIFLVGGLAVICFFVMMLGIHCGMIYSNSRSAVTISIGTVFFLFVGVATCIYMMVSFGGSFQTQLLPFLSLILGGGVGLFAALGARNPSSAMLTASILLPFATFYAITTFLLRDKEGLVLFVVAGAYGFTTAAMLVPAIYEFDIAMGRTRGDGED